MSFKLNVNRTPKSDAPAEDRPRVDYDALNRHIVEACKADKKPRSLPGYVSGIVDLGIQRQQDFEGPVESGKSYPDTAEFYKKDGKDWVRYPRKAVQQVAITVDFPQILVDYGKFYTGESAPVPYRMLLNGEFTERDAEGKPVRVIGRGFGLQELPDDKTRKWALPKQSILHKLASACELLDENGQFRAERVGELLGKVAQFQVEVSLKDGKYLNEKVNLAGVVPDGLPIPPLDESFLYGVNFSGENNPEHLKKLRLSIKNTIARALNFSGSDLEAQLADVKSQWQGGPPQDNKNKPLPRPKAPPKEEVRDFVDDEIPF